jgi:Family of unknown function (DUF5999)
MYLNCEHQPPCPSAKNPDRLAAMVVRDHAEQGWYLLCNGIVLFDDGGCLFPDGHATNPPTHSVAA